MSKHENAEFLKYLVKMLFKAKLVLEIYDLQKERVIYSMLLGFEIMVSTLVCFEHFFRLYLKVN